MKNDNFLQENKVARSDQAKKKHSFFSGDFAFWQRVPLKDKLFFVQYLRLMLKSGISIGGALAALSEQSESKYFSSILKKVCAQVEGGSSLADSLRPYEKIFGELFINMIDAGEVSGKLEDVLSELFVQEKNRYELSGKIKSAALYPAVIIFAMGGVGVFLMIYVVPVLVDVFKDLDAKLPWPTRVLIASSNFIQNHGFILLLSLVILVSFVVVLYRQPKVKILLEKVLLRLPVSGPIIKKLNLARFTRAISSLLRTDIPIVRTFEIASRTVGNLHYRQAIVGISEKIKSGSNINEAFSAYPDLFSPAVREVMSVGETTGSLDEISAQLASFYETEIKQTFSELPSLIEPILIMALGVGVGVVAVAVIMPIYNLASFM